MGDYRVRNYVFLNAPRVAINRFRLTPLACAVMISSLMTDIVHVEGRNAWLV